MAKAGAISEVPRVLGRYEVIGELARGGMASVHLGRVRGAGGFERIVAIKCCHPHLSSDPEFVAMFFDEARIAAAIHHPNVVATLDVGNDGPVLYHVMEYVEGERLVDLVRAANRGIALPVEMVARIMVDVLHGLHAAHEIADAEGEALHVVHRDVSPQNVMVGADGVSRIMDFGIARAAARATVTDKGVLKGKFSYMAPEQLLGQEIDRRCDIFAAGVVLWEALAQKRLFAGDSQGETLQRVMHVPVAPPSSIRAAAAPLDAVVLKALARPLDDRFETALAFAEAIEASVALAKPLAVGAHVRAMSGSTAEKRRVLVKNAGAETPTEISDPPTESAPVAPRARRVWPFAIAALLVPLAGVAIAWSAWPNEAPPRVEEESPVLPSAQAFEVPSPPPAEPVRIAPEPPPAVREAPAEERRAPARRRGRRSRAGSSPEYIPRSL